MIRQTPRSRRPGRAGASHIYRTARADIGPKVAAGFAKVGPTPERVERAKPRVEQAVFGFGFVNPLLALPQIYNIFALKHVAGLSLITVASALVMAVLWMAYGALSKQMVVWATSAVWVVLHAATLIGIALFAH